MTWQSEAIPLGSAVKVRYGKASAASDRDALGQYPVVGSAGEMARTHKPLTLEPAIVIGRKGNVGQSHYFASGCWPTDTTFYVESGPDIDPRFLLFQLEHLNLKSLDRSTATPSLRREDLEAQPVVLPCVGEQRRIVAILDEHLSDLDDGLASIELAKTRLTAFELRTLEDLVPIGAPLLALSDLAVEAGYGTSVKCVVGGAGPAVVRIPNLIEGRIDLTDEKRAQDGHGDLSNYMLRSGDLLIVRTNGSKDLIGRSAVVQDSIRAAFASYLIRFRLDSTQVQPEWVRLMLDRPSARAVLESLAASSAGQHNLSLGKLNPIEIPVPPFSLQAVLLKDWHERAAATLRLGKAIQDAALRAAKLRRAVMAAAFSGLLTGRSSDTDVISELAEEPA